MVSAERLRELFDYDPATGQFTRKVSCKRKPAGSVAGSVDSKGYLRFAIDKTDYRAHRLAWLYVHGCWPNGEIDHIDGDRTNNRICNLREADHTQNQWNVPKRRANSSGYKGVSWVKRDKKWQNKIRVHGKCRHIGYFDDPQQAHDAYLRAAEKLHGEFLRAA